MTTVIIVVLVLLLVAALRLWLTANRLDRLHVRTEAAWSALEGALARRIVATRAVAAAGGLDHPQSDHLRRLADIADHADRAHRADAENDLSRALSTVPAAAEPTLAAELADASERVVLARRFYNDAVRDTRALRAVLFTRVFGLAGRAAMPDYFEIAEFPHRPAAVSRTAARVILLDGADRVLLLSGTDPKVGSRWWITPGGGVEAGEELPDAARRELAEETGLLLAADDLVGPIWRRVAKFTFTGIEYEQTEFYFAARASRRSGQRTAQDSGPGQDVQRALERAGHPGVDAVGESGGDGIPSGTTLVAAPRVNAPPELPAPEPADQALPGSVPPGSALAGSGLAGSALPGSALYDNELEALDTSGHTALERRTLTGHRWWTADSLADTGETIYPGALCTRLPEVLAILTAGEPPAVVTEVD